MVKTKIARILSRTQVVLAAGAIQGVLEGMEFVIYDLSDPILDPETGEVLGQLELVKGKVTVSHVQDRISTATTASTRVRRVSDPLAELTSRFFFAPKATEVTVYEKLEIEGAQAIEQDLTVRVGDLARSN